MDTLLKPELRVTGEAQAVPRQPLPRVDSYVLLGGKREIIIEHKGDEYRLRITSQGKLLLTK